MKGRKKLERLPERYIDILRALRRARERLGTTPAVREIVVEIALEAGEDPDEAIANKTSSVHKDLHEMHRLKLVKRLDTPTRCWEVQEGVSESEIDWEALFL